MTESAIGPLRAGEADALVDLLDRCRLPEAGVREHLAHALVAREKERIVGSAVLELYPAAAAALVRSVAVDADRRGRGLGARLTEAILDLARRNGVRRVYLLTETAAEFFPRFGFRRVERAAVPEAVRASEEFTTACPQTAVAMERAL